MAARETFETLGAIHDVQQIDRPLQNADRKQDRRSRCVKWKCFDW
jgi:hypothetical protein